MFLTIRVLFTPDATEGVGEEQVTALKNSAAEEKESYGDFHEVFDYNSQPKFGA